MKTYKLNIDYKKEDGVSFTNSKANLRRNVVTFVGGNTDNYTVDTEISLIATLKEDEISWDSSVEVAKLIGRDYVLKDIIEWFLKNKYEWFNCNSRRSSWWTFSGGNIYFALRPSARVACQFNPGGMHW